MHFEKKWRYLVIAPDPSIGFVINDPLAKNYVYLMTYYGYKNVKNLSKKK